MLSGVASAGIKQLARALIMICSSSTAWRPGQVLPRPTGLEWRNQLAVSRPRETGVDEPALPGHVSSNSPRVYRVACTLLDEPRVSVARSASEFDRAQDLGRPCPGAQDWSERTSSLCQDLGRLEWMTSSSGARLLAPSRIEAWDVRPSG